MSTELEDGGMGMETEVVGGFPGASYYLYLVHKRDRPVVIYPRKSFLIFLKVRCHSFFFL